ncbi:hypothetical protein L1S34_14200 [Flavobacterium sp. K77]|uniref:YchJ family protein n=1 Tax=Flavobacterium sp. K77 TaxID=2910676 RepID=UPI001F1B6C4D|nr:YchJ family metal-binding protein [Flavobacterium sp. K77]MCF6142444.1 hypothetical protein [Flavobacterium sp. K77]
MNLTDLCPCCSGKNYSGCCQLAHLEHSKVRSAETLMRSRYSAFALRNAEYLMITTHSSQQKYHSKEDYLTWATQNEWLKLEIVEAHDNIVEFKAWYHNQEKVLCLHHERSSFVMDNGAWYYVDGIFV